MPEANTVEAQQAAVGGPGAACCSSLMAQCFTEFIGCMIFICTIALAVQNNTGMFGLAIGGVLMVLIYAGGHVSGGHYNPAVSLGIYIRDPSFGLTSMGAYMGAQVVGAIVGALIALIIMADNHDDVPEGKFSAGMMCNDKTGGKFISAALTELVYTYLLVYTVLNTATSDAKAYQGNSFFALAIGFSVVCGAYAAGSYSGGAFNPAVQLGLEFGNLFAGNDCFGCIYLLAFQLLGGALAGIHYKMIVVPYHAAQ